MEKGGRSTGGGWGGGGQGAGKGRTSSGKPHLTNHTTLQFTVHLDCTNLQRASGESTQQDHDSPLTVFPCAKDQSPFGELKTLSSEQFLRISRTMRTRGGHPAGAEERQPPLCVGSSLLFLRRKDAMVIPSTGNSVTLPSSGSEPGPGAGKVGPGSAPCC